MFDLFNGSLNILQNLFVINILLLNLIIYLISSLFRFTLNNETFYLNLNLILNFLILNFLILNFLN